MNRKGFTLIELLAVIIILGILMIIAIPSVTSYISDSRKNAYVDTAREIIAGARNLVNDGKLEMFDTDATYYIDVNCIKTENGVAKSPYGDFTKAYVGVTYDGKGYDYYWTSVDDAGEGIKGLIKYDNLDSDQIESDLSDSDISTLRGIDGRSKTIVISKENNCKKEGSNAAYIRVNSATGEEVKPICKRATTIHTATCVGSGLGCHEAGYYVGGSKNTATITFGQLWDGTSPLSAGDALECDVTGTGKYERFYYVSSAYNSTTRTFDDSKAILIYYANIENDGTTITAPSQKAYKYNGSYGHEGPKVGYKYLPSLTQWSNSQIIPPEPERQLRNESGGTSSTAGSLVKFTYTDKAARFLSLEEERAGCGTDATSNFGLDDCIFLFENVAAYYSNSNSYGYWLENPFGRNSNYVWRNVYYYTSSDYHDAWESTHFGVRPAIVVLKSNISSAT